MMYFPHNLLVYLIKCGLMKTENKDILRVIKRSFIRRNKLRERQRQFDNFLERHFLSRLQDPIIGQFYDHAFLVEQFNLWRKEVLKYETRK